MRIKLKYKKSTKGTHVYESTTEDSPLKSIYLNREQMKERHDEIVVTISVGGL